MKKLSLTGLQIRLLLKVQRANYVFYSDVSDFLKENEKLSDKQTAKLEVEEDGFADVIDMVNEYLENEDLDEEDFTQLQKLITQLTSEQEEEPTGDTAEQSGEPIEVEKPTKEQDDLDLE